MSWATETSTAKRASGVRRLLGEVRAGEDRLLSLATLLAFSCLAANVLVLVSVTALFLGARPRSDLPLAYASAAAFGVLSSASVASLSGRIARVREAVAVLLFSAALLVVSFAAMRALPNETSMAVYAVCSGMAALSIVQAFAIVNDCVDAEQAKRLLPLVGAGGTLGAVAAGGIMAWVAPRIGTRPLLLLGAVLLCAAALLARRLVAEHVSEHPASLRPSRPAPRRAPLASFIESSVSLLVSDRLVRNFALVQLALTFAGTLLKYELEASLQGQLAMDRIAAFLGLFNLAANGAVLLVQMLLEARLLRAFGVGVGLSSTPAVFAVLLPVLALPHGLWMVAAVRFAEHLSRFSIARTAEDLLLLPLSSTKRRRAKTFVMGALAPSSVLLAALCIVALHEQPLARIGLGWMAGLFALAATLRSREPYLERLRSTLSKPRLTLDPLTSPEIGMGRAAVESALELALSSNDPPRLRFALSMIAETQTRVAKTSLEPLYLHGDPRVREAAFRAAAALGNASWLPPLREALILEREDGARVECARALCAHTPHDRLDDLAPLLEDANPAVRAEALARRYAVHRESERATFDLLAQGDSADREGLARALSRIAVPGHGALLTSLLADASLEVRRAALSAAGRAHDDAHLPQVIAALEQRPLAHEALEVLKGWPAAALVPALEAAAAQSTSRRRRVLTIRVLGHVAHEKATEALLVLARTGSDDTQVAALRALVRKRSREQDLGALRGEAHERALQEVRMCHLARAALAHARKLDARSGGARARGELAFRLQRAEERLFAWLSLAYPPDEMQRAHVTLASGDRKAKGFALEVLEQRLEPRLRRAVTDLFRGERDLAASLAALELPAESSLEKLLEVAGDEPARWLSLSLGFAERGLREGEPAMSVLETMFVLRTVDLFSQLSTEELRAVAELAENVRLAPGAQVFHEGEPGDAFYIIMRGELEVTRGGARLATLKEGDCFGELALLDRGVRSATVTAKSDAELACIRADAFHELLDEAPSIARAMLGILARRTASLLGQKNG